MNTLQFLVVIMSILIGTARAGEVVINRCVGKWSNDSDEYYVQ